MQYTLYGSPGSCSLAVHNILHELKLSFTYKTTSIAKGDTRTPEFLAINPRASVPVLVAGDTVIREGGAILTYLLDTHDNTLLPKTGLERAAALEWLMWGNSTLHPAYARVFWLMRQQLDDATKTQLMTNAIQAINTLWSEADQHLGKQPWLAGANCTVGDILMTVIAGWNGYMPQPITLGSNVERVIAAVRQRPAMVAAMQAEGLLDKQAA